MLTKNQEIELEILRYGSNGEGIAIHEGMTVFVPFALAGEKVIAHIIMAKKTFAVGKLMKILKQSPDRIEAKCPLFTRCGGCDTQHMSYENQLKLKREDIIQTFKKFAKLDVDLIIEESAPLYYRNKMSVPVENGQMGFYRKNSHTIIDMDNCFLQNEKSISLFKEIRNYFLEKGGNSLSNLSHIVVRSVEEGSVVVLVLKSLKKDFKELYEKLKVVEPNLSFYVNLKQVESNVIFGKSFHHLYGDKFLKTTKMGLSLLIGAESFLQVNEKVSHRLYEDALKMSKTTEKDVMLNCFSGAGLLTALFAKVCHKAYGIEIVEEATHLADEMKKLNGLDEKMENLTGDVKDELPKLVDKVRDEGLNPLILLDPPRKGVEREVMELVGETQPEKLIYISCNPQTLARDVALFLEFTQNRYEISFMKSYDMFPQTSHVETLVCLIRK